MSSYLELTSDVLPYSPEHYRWARHRPAPDRVPIPLPGDEVWYRQDELGPVLHADVVAVASLEDLSDRNVWRWQQDLVDGRRVLALGFDPWPMVRVRVYFPHGPRTGQAQEARLPGASGWLPLDWRERHQRLCLRWRLVVPCGDTA